MIQLCTFILLRGTTLRASVVEMEIKNFNNLDIERYTKRDELISSLGGIAGKDVYLTQAMNT